MPKIIKLEVNEAKTSKWYAVADAREKSRKNQVLWPLSKQLQLQEIAVRASSIYNSRVFTNLREKFMVVKILNPRIMDRNSAAAIEFDRDMQKAGNTMVRTKTALLYRIK